MSKWLYDPERDKKAYQNYVHINDEMQIGCTYQYLVDICKANATYSKGKAKDPLFTYEQALRQQLKEYIAMIVEETWEDFDLVKENLAKELEKRYD